MSSSPDTSATSATATLNQVSPERLRRAIKTLRGVRHSKAMKEVAGQPDATRCLSAVGIGQAESTKAKLAGFTFDLVYSSPLDRAMNTGRIVAGREPTKLDAIAINPEDKADPTNIMFGTLLYAPAADYFAHELGEHLKAWAYNAVVGLVEAVEASGIENANVVFFGHAVMTPALFWAIGLILEAEGNPAGALLQEEMLVTQLGEAAVISLDLANGGATFEVVSPDQP